MSNADTARTLADTGIVDHDRFAPAKAAYRATLRGHGGAAAMGYGETEDAAIADLADTIEFNLDHNGRAIA